MAVRPDTLWLPRSRTYGGQAGYGIKRLKQYPVAGRSHWCWASPSIALTFEGWFRWPLARWNKIKVSVRLSVKTVLARAYLSL